MIRWSLKLSITIYTCMMCVTGADAAMGRQLLEACGGNLELAINMHMEGGGSGAGASNAV
jgi:hypothetical protein